ncbi:hypothetical protein PFICI_00183 [Pestalotiopsis fici W106-1]|uniref:Ig-like domain-containing protein n=1 Tax=Pestalotiopsis fici (strain W106-1 / CGMCC3.15140) TaxID=1229662 RepID=W3XK29_PESFW|nr:uncharacterized protein PFICI_00183 [Pestalotiopsis fici W106-1]ETS86355.1 hypothetical protein PFICI_00183 [Pestalotiopsis fici W106-1]
MSKMHLLTLAALVSGSLASAIPSLNPFAVAVAPEQRRQELVSVDVGTCDSYVTVTVTPDVVTATNTEFATTTAETVQTTDIVTVDTTQDVTETATITEFETSSVTETVTAATVTETQTVYQRKKKRGCGLKHPTVETSAYPAQSASYSQPASSSASYPASSSAPASSSSASASVSASSSESASLPVSTSSESSTISSSESSSTVESSTSSVSSTTPVICTATVTLEAEVTTTTVTVTSSETATNVETVTSTIVDTITTTVSTTEVITTIVPTTVAVTATASETVTLPSPTPTIVLQATSGTASGQYLYLISSGSSYSYLGFTSSLSSATSFYLDGNKALVPTSHTNWVGLYAPGTVDSYIIESTNTFGQGGIAMICQFGGSAVQVGQSGSFTCPNDGNSNNFWYTGGQLGVAASSTTKTLVTLNYAVVGVN